MKETSKETPLIAQGRRKTQAKPQQSAWSHHFSTSPKVDATLPQKSFCDRRQSRAARSIVRELLLDFLATPKSRRSNRKKNKNKNDKSSNNAMDDDASPTVWDLLDQVLSPTTTADHTRCPLWPDRDLLRHDEEHGVVLLPARKYCNQWGHGSGRNTMSSLMFHLPPRGYSYNPHFYQCGYCTKVFSTRYYLDQHLQNHHHSHHASSVNQTNNANLATKHDMICPARDWCAFLPDSQCQETALQLEPYYDRGSEGRRDDRYSVEVKLWKQAHQEPCTQQSVQAAQRACQEVLDHCFVADTELYKFWNTRVCQRLHCPDRFHRLYFAAHEGVGHAVVRHVHEWQEEWHEWSTEHHLENVSVRLLWLVVLLSLIYAVLYSIQYNSHGRFLVFQSNRKKGSNSSRLLRPCPKRAPKSQRNKTRSQWYNPWASEKGSKQN